MSMRKGRIWIFFGIAIVLYCIASIIKNSFTRLLIGEGGEVTKVVIINEKNYMPNQSVKARFSYSYQFVVNGNRYTGNSHDTTLMIGDSVEIEYNKNFPSFNRPLNTKN